MPIQAGGIRMIEELILFLSIFILTLIMLKYWYRIFGYIWITMCFKKTHDFFGDTSQLNTPFKAQAYMDYYFTYRKDTEPKHQWQRAEDTYEWMLGDCEDWALFAAYCLKHLNPLIFCCYNKNTGHATCLLTYSKFLITLGTKGYNHHSYIELPKLAKFFYSDADSYSLYDWNGEFIEHNYNIGGV